MTKPTNVAQKRSAAAPSILPNVRNNWILIINDMKQLSLLGNLWE